MIVRFIVPVQPKPKERPRFSNGHAYTPTKTRNYERTVAQCYRAAHGRLFTGAVTVEILFGRTIPKSWSKGKQQAARTGVEPCMTKPDIDNLIKAVLDGLNGVAWVDDKQVVALIARKGWTDDGRVEITVRSE